ncbi:MAG: nuclear transport factor 2 family protein [Gemmatimonadales bacterium]|nr:nuclear transport factor 2 family protein [Gemmatimonadales bacterium]MBP9200310.1 nuclear transport factor 2 family protein [Gemmatimonadales bacterium]
MLVLLASALLGPTPHAVAPQDSLPCAALEHTWNAAHLAGDTVTLKALWADDLVVTVPEMPTFTKADLLGFWRSGRATITRYETSALGCHDHGTTGVVTGRLRRERDFNGQRVVDDWRFTKVYVRQHGDWTVVAYHASRSPE